MLNYFMECIPFYRLMPLTVQIIIVINWVYGCVICDGPSKIFFKHEHAEFTASKSNVLDYFMYAIVYRVNVSNC